MLLSDYDRVVCLCVDKRFNAESDRIRRMLSDHGVPEDNFQFFVDGDGRLFPSRYYSQITQSVPSDWQHGKGAYAHSNAMRSVLQTALGQGIDALLWVEDDCYFRDDFDEVVAKATEQLRGLPAWDMLYYGVNHTWSYAKELAPNVLQCYGSLTTHCMGIKRHMFEKILSLPQDHVIDYKIAHGLHHTHTCYAVWPNVARQKPGFSHLTYANMDYEHYFDSKGMNWA